MGFKYIITGAAALVLIPVVGSIAAVILYCWLIGRLSLVFPAIALDQGVSFKYSWQLTANHQFLMFLIVIIYPILLSLLTQAIGLIPNMFLLTSFISTLTIVFVVAALSVSYQAIYSEVNEAS